MRAPTLRPYLRLFAPSIHLPAAASQTRCLHKTRPPPSIPQPRPFVPDVETFLTLIGRGLSKHASKFPSWESLFSLTSPQLKELGIEPPRNRRYLLQWMQRYRKGALGPGGDFQFVKDGEALLKVATPPAAVISDARYVVNVPHQAEEEAEQKQQQPETLPRPIGYTVHGLRSIAGPYATPLPGQAGAVVKVTEGMWEQRRGRKVDGGERRQAEVRFKKRSAERRAAREAEMLAKM
ncbi:telomere length regulation protein [Purpureocillium takamizusanense]|uniref:Small ribosomal subunit protein mS41 n=1 Tax=Purpureocillium takamizusanense TaxID=2060973 RepID=A0A9Q8QI84_9HYPO|nr:telomere length regulation protein [Purpureocillium takamizusanense]UNI19117.1 telomere length regulation protein [Purpureocillium takamizusanense]